MHPLDICSGSGYKIEIQSTGCYSLRLLETDSNAEVESLTYPSLAVSDFHLPCLLNSLSGTPGFRTSLHYSPCFAFIDGVKECGGYTVVLLLVTMEEKSVGYTVFLHLNEGRKECGVHCFSPGVGKTRNRKPRPPIITTKP